MSSPYPLRTERLVLRIMRTTDAALFAAYRNDPEVARYQSWTLPFTEQDALSLLFEQDGRDDVIPGQWTQLAVERDGELIGDACARLDNTGGVAEIGFTLVRSAQGRGYASEAAQALVSDLVERGGSGARVRGAAPRQRCLATSARELRPDVRGDDEEVGPVAWGVGRQHDLWRHRRGVQSLGRPAA